MHSLTHTLQVQPSSLDVYRKRVGLFIVQLALSLIIVCTFNGILNERVRVRKSNFISLILFCCVLCLCITVVLDRG